KRVQISKPYDPVLLTHVGFDSSQGQFTGLPKDWQQSLQEIKTGNGGEEESSQAVQAVVKPNQASRAE
ncbi:hypothetical protein BD410DRAFT_696387, partial [Rickenella mellea]